MLKNYFKIAWRNITKQKGYAFINIFGLAVGLASCIIILLYITHELSFDRYNENADRIYRVNTNIDFSGNYLEMANAPALMGPTLKEDFPEVEATARFRYRGSYLVKKDNITFREERLIFADSSIFDVFTLPLLNGNPETALTSPNTVVLSSSIAKKYFGEENPIGESLLLDNNDLYTITGIMKDIPDASHFHFDFLLSLSTLEESNQTTWFSNNFKTYILLKEGANVAAFKDHFETIKSKYMEPELNSLMGVGFDEFVEAGNSYEFSMQPLLDIHLTSSLDGELEPNGSISYVYIFGGLAVFILILACINFMNLATARSSKRAKEVGIRKTLGSVKKQLAVQFLSESVLLSLIAFLFSLLLVEISLPTFSEIAGRTINSNYFSQPIIIGAIAATVLITGLLAGSYPALLLSSFKPVSVLKGTFTEGYKHNMLRKGLVIFQFSISMIIVVGLLVINQQMNFIKTKNLGFNKEQVLILNDTYALGSVDNVETFRDEMMKNPIFQNATISGFYPVEGYGESDTVYWPESKDPGENNSVSMQVWRIDENYIPTLGMEILEGRNFSEEFESDVDAVILTEATVKKLQLDNPIGKVIKSFGDDSSSPEDYQSFTIIGVVKNFHYQSLRENITPLGFFYRRSTSNIAFKVNPENAAEAISSLSTAWEKVAPGLPFNYSFLSDQFDQMYRAENRTQNLMAAFSFLAIIIACLGLFGLSAYSAERRTKEIGLRKVLGASIHSILALISKEFIQLIFISFVIAIPVAYYVTWLWLQSFTYRTNIGITVFIVAGAGMLIIALATVSWQSIKAALTNPVESLKSE